MIRSLIIVLILACSYSTYGQNFCTDSSTHERYSTVFPFSDSVMLHKQIKTIDEGTLTIGHIKTTTVYGYGIVIRTNKDGTIRWVKRIASNPFSGYIGLETVDEANNGNIHILARFNNGIYDGRPPFHLLVLSPDGDVINQKRFGFTNSPALNNKVIRTSLILKHGADSLLYVLSGQINAFTENQLFLVTADNAGIVGSSTIINMQPSGGWDFPVFRIGRLNGGQLSLYGSSRFIGQCVNGSSNGLAFFNIKIDMLSKSVLLNKAYCAPENSTLSSTYRTPRDFFSTEAYDNAFFLSNGNIAMTKAYNGTDSDLSGITNRLFSISIFDPSFNHLHSEYVVTGNMMMDETIQELFIDSNGIRHFSFHDYENKKIYYALADSNNNLFLQKKIPFPSSKQYTDFTRINTIESRHIVNFATLSYDNNSTHIDRFKILIADTSQICFGEDTAFLRFIPAQVSPINWQGQFINQDGMLEEQTINFFSANYPMQRTVICNIVRRCDTIKISAPNTVCNISQPVVITAHKNPLCDGKVNFIFDTAQVSSFQQINDTTIHLFFTKSWSGKIYARPSACDKLIDSVTLNVSAPDNFLNLGKDTLFCKDKSYLLNAGNTFANYTWQNGSTDSFFIANSPGSYYVTVKDHCNRQFSDTIKIIDKPFGPWFLKDMTICKDEDLLLSLPGNYLNYNWEPEYNIKYITPFRVLLSPEINTSYHVETEVFAGCKISDTININVKNCPQYIYFPSAFSPNNDGLNDMLRPTISGKLLFYDLKIYERNGQIIFSSNDPATGWNGSFRGAHQNSGIYVYVCRYRFINMPDTIAKGTIMLIR